MTRTPQELVAEVCRHCGGQSHSYVVCLEQRLTAALDANREMHELVIDVVAENRDWYGHDEDDTPSSLKAPAMFRAYEVAKQAPTGKSLRTELAEAQAEIERLMTAIGAMFFAERVEDDGGLSHYEAEKALRTLFFSLYKGAASLPAAEAPNA